MDEAKRKELISSYDLVAEEYARHFFDELSHKPLDRKLLERLVVEVGDRGPICDLGCGPGHVANYLHQILQRRATGGTKPAEVLGVDLSGRMVDFARKLSPEIIFLQGDMLSLDFPDHSWGGIAAFYSFVHIPKTEIVTALRECSRVLRPGGILLMAFHIGDEIIHRDELLGSSVSIDFLFFQPAEMTGWLKDAGFEIIEVIERDPYEGVEYPSRRAYIFARSAGILRRS